MIRIALFFFTILPLSIFGQEELMELNFWDFIDAEKTMNVDGSYPAIVPGVIHLDLMSLTNSDFYQGNFEHSEYAKWIENTDWIYSTHFEMDGWSFSKENEAGLNAELVFEGIDTYADIYFNDSLVLQTNNMFRKWIIPVNKIYKDGMNTVTIHFKSPLNYNRENVKNAPYELPSGNELADLKVSAYTRKAAYQFGWDFGPRFVTCGIWRPCYLRLWKDFRIDDYYVTTESISGNKALMNFHCTIECDQKQNENLELEFMGKFIEINLDSGKNEIQFYHEIDDAKLWHPNGHGEAYLYKSEMQILKNREEVLLTKSIDFAIRTIELINEPDSIGTSFYFKVNGKPIFIKGSNYIPQDLFLPRVTSEQTYRLLNQVKDANMNMIRVWGGGIYEEDNFYRVCDELGIMVWQDFMFANSMYPNTKEFHENVEAEIVDNVKRLRNHPCIALWCGNNEIEVAWHNWGWQKQFGYSEKDSTEIWENYLSIFHELIPKKLKELDSTRAYIPSSPQSNWGTKENFNHGAMHYWGVWHGKEDLDSFKTNVGRFMVEYGFQSYPLEDWLEATIENNINPDDEIFKNRQKSYIGDVLIEKEIQKYFGDLQSFSDWLWASEFIQSQALKIAIQSHRLAAPHCMGTLFWQLNDCWPGASWSIIDYYGNEKIAYQEVRKLYSPVIAIVDTTKDVLSVSVISDIDFSGALTIGINKTEDDDLIKTFILNFTIKANETKKLWSIKIKKYLKKYPASEYDILLRIPIDPSQGFGFTDNFYFRKLAIDEIY